MSLRLAVTRAEPEASRTASRIDARGGEAVIAPLLTIEQNAQLDASLDGVQALLFTSANGVRAFGASKRDVLVFAVGENTASAARNAGFANVQIGEGDSEALARAAIAALDPRAGKVVHVSGTHIAGDAIGLLTQAGFSAERRIAYEARAAAALPPALAARLASTPPRIDRVLFHSARAAEIFTSLARTETPALMAVCLSEQVAAAAKLSPWARVIVAARPREDALLDAAFS